MTERFFIYSQLVTPALGANEIRHDQRLEIRQDADFMMRGMGMLVSNGATAGRFRRADSSWFTGQDFFHLNGFFNTGGFARPTPIRPQIRYPQSSAFVYDLQDLGGAGDPAIYPVLWGVERYEDAAIAPPALPAKYLEYPYTARITVSITGLGTQTLNLPVKCQTGETFVIRELSWRSDPTLATPLLLNYRLFDEHGKPFQNDWVPLRCVFSGPTEANEPYPSTPFPELVVPALGSYTIDIFNRQEAGPFTVELAFGGVRLVEVAA